MTMGQSAPTDPAAAQAQVLADALRRVANLERSLQRGSGRSRLVIELSGQVAIGAAAANNGGQAAAPIASMYSPGLTLQVGDQVQCSLTVDSDYSVGGQFAIYELIMGGPGGNVDVCLALHTNHGGRITACSSGLFTCSTAGVHQLSVNRSNPGSGTGNVQSWTRYTYQVLTPA